MILRRYWETKKVKVAMNSALLEFCKQLKEKDLCVVREHLRRLEQPYSAMRDIKNSMDRVALSGIVSIFHETTRFSSGYTMRKTAYVLMLS
jgi:hypothetical protein